MSLIHASPHPRKAESIYSCYQNELRGAPSPSESDMATKTQPPQAPSCDSMEQFDQLLGTELNQLEPLADQKTMQDGNYLVDGRTSSPGAGQELPDLTSPLTSRSSPSSPDMSVQAAPPALPLVAPFLPLDYGSNFDEPRMVSYGHVETTDVGSENSHPCPTSWFGSEALSDSLELPTDFTFIYQPEDSYVMPYLDAEGLENVSQARKKPRRSTSPGGALHSSTLKSSCIKVTKRHFETDSDAKVQILGCPFYKKRPREHRECSKYVLKRLKDVKQHLKRNHAPPDFYCARCYKVFSQAKDRDSHTRNAVCACSEKPRIWDISTETMNKLMPYSSRNKSTQDQWFELWDTIFEGVPRPTSAYAGNQRMEAVSLLRDLWEDKQDDLLRHAGRDSSGLKAVMEEMLDRLEAEA